MRTAAKKDAVIVGLGWTGSIMAMELAEEGLEVLALERGEDRNAVPDFQYPDVADELRYGVRMGFMQKPAKSTVTIRHDLGGTALPYRQLGAFLPGDGVGGAGIHWNGLTWRPMAEEFELRSHVERNFGASIIPEDMTIQDWGISYKELGPYMDRFEHVAGVSGQAGNIGGEIIPDVNPFEVRARVTIPCRRCPTPMMRRCFAKSRRKRGIIPSRCRRLMRQRHTGMNTACNWARAISVVSVVATAV